MKTLNELIGGVDSDADILRLKNNMLRNAKNIRISNLDERGMVVINIEGNEKAFNITAGFIPLGYCTYNGIAYIFSVNSSTNEGEIGTYPSPNVGCAGGFAHVYAPLINFTGIQDPKVVANPIRQPFRTDKLNFDCNHQVECFVRMDFDDTVNIYFCDQQKNPFRIVNSGFTQDGVCVNRYYWNGSFPNGIEVVSESQYPISCNLLSIEQNGALLAGNYFVYARYSTANFSTTSFNCEDGPYQIDYDNPSAGITIDGQGAGVATNKSIRISLGNFDPDYTFIELAYVYYGGGQSDNYLIDIKYDISGVPVGGTLTVEITGLEPTVLIDDADIAAEKSSDDIPETITQFENRAWMGNLISRPIHHQSLEDYAKCIVITPDATKQVDDAPWFHMSKQNLYNNQAIGMHKDYMNTYSDVGYFRGETYCMAIRFVLKSGRVSLPYTMSGSDYWMAPGVLNQNGIIRFPSTNQSPLMDQALNWAPNTSPMKANIMGVRFDNSNCLPFNQQPQWFQDNVIGFYFCRAERKPNLVYQGIMLPTWWNSGWPPYPAPPAAGLYAGLGTHYFSGDVHQNGNYDIPLWNNAHIDVYHNTIDPLSPVSQIGHDGVVWDMLSGVKHGTSSNIFDFGANTLGGGNNPARKLRYRGIFPGYAMFWHADISGADDTVSRAILGAQDRGLVQHHPAGGAPQDTGHYNDLRYGIFSADHFFREDFSDGDYFIYNAGKYIMHRSMASPTNAFKTDCLMQLVVEQVGQEFTGVFNKTYPIKATNLYEDSVFASNQHVSGYDQGILEYRDSGHAAWPFTGSNPFLGNLYEKNSSSILPHESPAAFCSAKFGVSRYIGIRNMGLVRDFENTNPGDPLSQVGGPQFHSLTNIYKYDPVSPGYDYNSVYTPASELFYAISDVLPISSLALLSTQRFYQGDCFMQRTYVKQLSTYNRYDGAIIAQQTELKGYASGSTRTQREKMDSGILHGFMSENSINTAMRYNELTTQDRYWPEDYVPSTLWSFLANRTLPEPNNINDGYNRTLGKKSAYGFDPNIPLDTSRYPTRIRYSQQHTPNSFLDFYKNWDLVGFRDFDFRLGPIKKIMDFSGKLWSFQESGISGHIVNERITMTPDGASSGELLLGKGDVLSQKQDIIVDTTGTQHHWSVNRSENYIYGADANKRLLWRLGPDGKFEPLSITKSVQKIVYDIFEQYSDHSDIIHKLNDNPICSDGISVSFDRKYKELVYNFIYDKRKGKSSRTIRFSELIDAFTGDYSNTTPMSILINEDYFSFNPAIFPSMNTVLPSTAGDCWLEGVKRLVATNTDSYTLFFGSPYSAEITFVVNEHPELAKMFSSMELTSSQDAPVSIDYATEYQTAIQNPFLNPAEFYIDPKYRENLWRFPVRRADAAAIGVYGVRSPMRGKWMKVHIVWNQRQQFHIKSVITDYTPSNS